MANEKRRLIDAKPIKQFVEDGLNNPDLKKAFGYDAIQILAEIEYAPRVDAVEVVRCKDCEHFNKRGYDEDNAHEEDSSLHMGWCAEWRRETQACRFCSYGERREGE